MMSAKEMFEKLGYEYIDTRFGPYYQDERNISKGEFKEISFIEKDDICYHTVKASYGNGIPKDLTMDELKAIIRQCKELGWLEEEKKTETNIEHYFEYLSIVGSNGFALVNGRCAQCSDTHCSECDFRGDCIKKKFIWLASPYEKPTYKLTKFEKELLECYSDIYSFKVFNSLNGMKEKGYFKGIDDNELIGDILAKCEVVG